MAATELRKPWDKILKAIDSMTIDSYICKPGLCVIINNMNFFDKTLDLPSGMIDETSLKNTFTALGFVVKAHQNLNAADIESTVKAYSEEEHTGAFFLIISSHGGSGDVVYGTDGATVKVQKLKKRFFATKCPSLAGIPKIFVIDACRGYEEERSKFFKSKFGPQPFTPDSMQSVTDSADIMTVFASTRDNIAGYDDKIGSFFIHIFVLVLEKNAAQKNLIDMITIVQRQIQELKVQTPELTSTFTKHYYI